MCVSKLHDEFDMFFSFFTSRNKFHQAAGDVAANKDKHNQQTHTLIRIMQIN